MTCVMCGHERAVMWTIEVRITAKRVDERAVCNACELEYRKGRKK